MKAARSAPVRLVLPLPPKELSPNARVHWRVKAASTKQTRLLAHSIAAGTLIAARRKAPGWKRAEVQITYSAKRRRWPDPDNLLASMKASIDGMTDAGLFADDRGLVHLPPVLALDRKSPRVEITITPLPAAQA